MKRTNIEGKQHTWPAAHRAPVLAQLPRLSQVRWRKLALQLTAVLTTAVFMSACSTAPVSESAENSSGARAAELSSLIRNIRLATEKTNVANATAYHWYMQNVYGMLNGRDPEIKDRLGNVVARGSDLIVNPSGGSSSRTTLCTIRDALVSAGQVPGVTSDDLKSLASNLHVSDLGCPTVEQQTALYQSIDHGAIFNETNNRFLQEHVAAPVQGVVQWFQDGFAAQVQNAQGSADTAGNPIASWASMAAGWAMQGAGSFTDEALGSAGRALGVKAAGFGAKLLPIVGWLVAAVQAIQVVDGAILSPWSRINADLTIAALAAASFTVSMDSVMVGVLGVQKNVEILVLAAADAVNDVSGTPATDDGATVTGPAPSAGAGAQVEVTATTVTGEPASVATTGGGSGGGDSEPPQKDGNPLVQAVKRVLTYFKCLPQFDLVTCGGAIAITTVIVWPAVDRSLGITKTVGRVYQLLSGNDGATAREGSTVVLTPSITARPATDADLTVGQPTDDELLQDRLDLYCSAEAAVVYSDRLQALNEDACGVFRAMTEEEQGSIIDAVGGAVPCAGYGEIVQNIEEGWSTVCRFLTNVITAREKMVNYQKAVIELEMKKRENDRQWTESLQNSGDYLAPLLGLLDEGGTITATVEVPTAQP